MSSENPVQDGSQPPQTLADYSAALEQVPLAADTRRTYASRVRMYLAWLAGRPAALNGDPLANRRARDRAVRDYRHYLLREADPERSVRYVNNALVQIRWLRAVEDWPHPRDRALALLPFYAGLRIGDAAALDVLDCVCRPARAC